MKGSVGPLKKHVPGPIGMPHRKALELERQ